MFSLIRSIAGNLGSRNKSDDMNFFDHIEVLRGHIMRILIVLVVLAVAIFCLKDFVFTNIIFAPLNEDFITYRTLCRLSHWVSGGDGFCMKPEFHGLQALSLGETFSVHLKISFILAIIVAFPYVLWEFWRFIRPGLYEKERRMVTGAVGVCSVLFLLGTLFGYFVAAPMAINFMLGYTLPFTENKPSVESYIDMITLFTLPLGLIFELPVIVYFLAKLGIMTHRPMQKYWRQAIVVLLFVAAIITPSPDMFSQTVVVIPLWGLYMFSIYLAKKQTLKREKAQEVEED